MRTDEANSRFSRFCEGAQKMFIHEVRAPQVPLQLDCVCCICCAIGSFTQSPAVRQLAQVLVRYSTVPTGHGIPRRSHIQLLTVLKVA